MAAASVRDELIELRGLRFHYRDWAGERPDAPALVLLHGYTGHARSWDAFAVGMTDRYRVLALDQRGHGESGWAGEGGYGIEAMADDLAAFVSALGLTGFTLLGLSMGGMVTMEYGGRRPSELAAAVIVDIAPEIVSQGMNRIVDGQKVSDVFESREAAFVAARANNALAPDEHLRHRIDNNLMRLADGTWTWRYDRVLRSPASLGRRDPQVGWRSCSRIAVPTLLIRGDVSDILSEGLARKMLEAVPDARLATVTRSGHSVPLDAPQGFLAAAREFLTG